MNHTTKCSQGGACSSFTLGCSHVIPNGIWVFCEEVASCGAEAVFTKVRTVRKPSGSRQRAVSPGAARFIDPIAGVRARPGLRGEAIWLRSRGGRGRENAGPMFIEHESPVGRIAPKPVFEVGHPTLRALLDIRLVVAFGCEERDLRSVHADKTGDDGNAEASANPRGPPRAVDALAESLSFNCVGSLGHNVSGSHNDLALSQSTHDVSHDGGRRRVSRQNVFWPEFLHVLEHKLTTSRRARFAHKQSGGAKVAQSGTAEDSTNAMRNEDNQTAIAATQSLIFNGPTGVNDDLGEEF